LGLPWSRERGAGEKLKAWEWDDKGRLFSLSAVKVRLNLYLSLFDLNWLLIISLSPCSLLRFSLNQ
jgi:hypothetical protein